MLYIRLSIEMYLEVTEGKKTLSDEQQTYLIETRKAVLRYKPRHEYHAISMQQHLA